MQAWDVLLLTYDPAVFYFQSGIAHDVLWALGGEPTEDMYCREIESRMDSDQLDILHCVNPIRLRSVGSIPHCHVFSRFRDPKQTD